LGHSSLGAVSKKGTVPLPHWKWSNFVVMQKGTVPFFETAP
jgi:hypothetical protein